MKAVIALGNPGARYARTRHNIGWMVVDAVADYLHADIRPGKGEYYEARVEVGGHQALLVKPTTYMNNSGTAALDVAERYGIAPGDMLAVVDEIQFPVGRIRLKPSGTSAGHNGTESLIYHLGTTEFARLRCGIGSAFGNGELVEYVLSPFPADEHDRVENMIIEARDAVLLWITEGTARAMNRVNAQSAKADAEVDGEQPDPHPATSSAASAGASVRRDDDPARPDHAA